MQSETTAVASAQRVVNRLHPGLLPGAAVSIVIALVATGLARFAPVVGAPVIAVVLGLLLSAAARRESSLQLGIAFTGKYALQCAVVLLGAQLSLRQVAHVGVESLPVMITTIVVCLVLAYLLGRWMDIDFDLRTLIGVGTAICGASAIAAASSTIRAKHSAIAYAISTIFVFNIAAVLIFPSLGHILGMSQHAFGLFAGTAVNDTSSVVAAATSYGSEAGRYAVVVKLTRTLLIIPICLGLAMFVRRRDLAEGRQPEVVRRVVRYARLVPWFLVGFLLLAALKSAQLIPNGSGPGLQHAALFLTASALGAIGLSTDLAALRRAGYRPLLLGLCLWAAVSLSSLVLQAIVL